MCSSEVFTVRIWSKVRPTGQPFITQIGPPIEISTFRARSVFHRSAPPVVATANSRRSLSMRTSLTQRGGLSGGPSPTWHAPKRRSVTHLHSPKAAVSPRLREGLYDHARGETARCPDQHLTQMDDGSPTATVPP